MELAQTWKFEERNRKLVISRPEISIKHQLNKEDLSQERIK